MLTKYLLLTLVFTCSLNPLHLVVHAQDADPLGFYSIDCGLSEGSEYKDSFTGLIYKSDASLIDSGESISLSPTIIGNDVWTPLTTVRSFPQGKKNCYTIQPSPGKGSKYLIRASFLYGNYDSLNQFPTFDLNLGTETWSEIVFEDNLVAVRKEIIHTLSSDYIHICLVKTGTTTPFISTIELRPLNSSMYPIDSGSLQTYTRVHFDPTTTNTVIRYPEDIYDRRWVRLNRTNTRVLSTSLDINNRNDYLVPVDVLRTACTPNNSNDPIQFYWETTNTSIPFYIYMHFAEVEIIPANQSREFNIYLNGTLWYGPLVPDYLSVNTIYPQSPETGNTRYTALINRTERSTLPPIINGLEIYTAKNFSNLGTNETDVAAIRNIKSTYGVIRDWQGDPCEPEDFSWAGLQCSYLSSDYSARIISLNLSTSGLTGIIVPSIANLTELKTLDLSYNNLSGQVPGFLSQLALSVLNLKGNNFTGPLPAQLLEMKKNGSLLLSFDGPGNDTSIELCGPKPCKSKGNNSTPAVSGAVVGSVLLLAAILFGIWPYGY